MKYERAMKRAVGQTNRTARRIESRFERMNRGMSASFAVLGRTMAGAFAGAAVLRGTQQLIEAATRIENQLRVTGLAGEDLEKVYGSLRDAALRNAAPFESLAELYSRVSLVQSELGVSTEQLLGFTDNVALALRVAGTDAQSASGALLQLSQAMGSGVVRAEEFNSILEGAPTILQAVAAGIVEAGGSVAKLRQIMLDGNLSSRALFDGLAVGSEVLRDRLAGSVLTVDQAMRNLNTQLIDAARNFDDATGVSAGLTSALASLGSAVQATGTFFRENAEPIREFVSLLGAGIDMISRLQGVPFSELARSNEIRRRAEEAIGGASQNVIDQTFHALGETPQDQALLDALGVSSGGPLAIEVSGANPISISDPKYAVSGAGGTGSAGGGSGGGGGGKSFDELLADQQRELDILREKTALQASLNPLVNDYGFAIEKLRVQQELENEATRAGLELTPERKAAIESLATGFAHATTEAERLAQQQEAIVEHMDGFKDAAKSALSGFISDLRSGKSAAEALTNTVNRLADRLIDMALNEAINALFSNLIGSFGGSFIGGTPGAPPLQLGYQKGVPGFATGTANTGGRRGDVRGLVHGQEAVIPLPSGGKIPVDLRMPEIAPYAGAEIHVSVGVSADSAGNIMPFVESVSSEQAVRVTAAAAPTIVQRSKVASGAALRAGEFEAGMARYGVSSQARRR